MKNIFQFLLAPVLVTLVSCSQEPKTQEKQTTEHHEMVDTLSAVERGKYLVQAMGCEDCHSPKKMGALGPEFIEELRFSGYPADRPVSEPEVNALRKGWVLMGGDLTSAVGPWGHSFAANITSDPTGIGNWTEEAFIACMRSGKSKGLPSGRPLLPPMPWMGIAKLNDTDLRAIFAFLQSTKPVQNVAPANRPPQQI